MFSTKFKQIVQPEEYKMEKEQRQTERPTCSPDATFQNTLAAS